MGWLKSSPKCRNFDKIDGEPMEFEWNIFPGFNTLQLSEEVKSLLLRLDDTPENFTGKTIFMLMFSDISCGSKDNEKERLANAKLVSLFARRLGKGQLSFIDPGSEKKWYSVSEDSPQGVWDNIAERMLVEFAESGCPFFRATSPLSRGQLKSKGHGKLSIHYAADQETIETIFRIIVSANQLSLCGAVAEICEEYESLHERTGRPVVMGQSSSSLVLSVITTEVPLDSDDPRWRSCTGDLSWSSRQAPWQESGRGGRRRWTGGKRTGGRRRSRNNQVHMHGWDDVKRHGRGLEPM